MDLSKFPKAPKKDFSISCITDRIIFDIIELSEAGTDSRKISVEVDAPLMTMWD